MSLEIRLPNGKTLSPSAAQLQLALSKKKIPRGTEVREDGGEWMSIHDWVEGLRASRVATDGSIEAQVIRPPSATESDSSSEAIEPTDEEELTTPSAGPNQPLIGSELPGLPEGLFVDLFDHPDHGLAAVTSNFFILRRAAIGGLFFAGSLLLGQMLGQHLGLGPLFPTVGAAFGLALALCFAGWVNHPQNMAAGVGKATIGILAVAAAGGIVVGIVQKLFGLLIGFSGQFLGAIGLAVVNSLGSLVYVAVFLVLVLSGLVIASWLALNLIAGAEVDNELLSQLRESLGQPRTLMEAGLPTLFSLTLSGFLLALIAQSFSRFSALASSRALSGLVDLEAGIFYLFGHKMTAGLTASSVPTTAALFAGLVAAILAAVIMGLVLAIPLLMLARAVMIYLPVRRANLRVVRAATLPLPEPKSDLPTYAPYEPDEEELSPAEQRSAEIAAAVDQVEVHDDLPPSADDDSLSITWESDDELELETRDS